MFGFRLMAVVAAVSVAGLLFFDHFRPRALRQCEALFTIDSAEKAREFAYLYWRQNERRVMFGGNRYLNVDAILKGLDVDGRIEIDSKWYLLNLGFAWHVSGEINKYFPEYYGFGLIFNRCGRIIKHEKVGNG